jgi:predicted nucleic acid-binding protein
MSLIYLDVCCFNRPFDDLTQERIRLEAEAVLLILERCQSGSLNLLGSEALDFEIARIADAVKKQKVLSLNSLAASRIQISEEVANRARDLQEYGFHSLDSLHLACAEAGNADIFLTTDDRLLRRAIRNRDIVRVTSANPVLWLMETTDDGYF